MHPDKTINSRLKAMFSTGTIVRRSGGKTLKVSDFDAIAAFGSLQNNTLTDRFTRLYNNTSINQNGSGVGIQVTRPQLYVDYEAMDTDPLCAKALDILSEEATQKNEIGEVLSVRSSNENIQDELYNLYYNILDIETNLPAWIRNMVKYGDTFLSLDMDWGIGVYGAYPLSVYSVTREEALDANNQHYIRFVINSSAVSTNAHGAPQHGLEHSFENFQVAHFRLLGDANFMPYGRSWLEPARKVFKQYILLKDAAILHRVMRAPEKRIFYYNVGNLPANEVDAFMQKQISQAKKAPLFDQKTGQYNLKYSMMNMLDDFHIPVRNNDTTTRIDTAKGLEYAGMDDIYFFQNELLAALGVPKAFLNYSDELNGKSTLSGLSMNFSKTIEKIQRVIIKQLEKIGQVHLAMLEYEDSDLSNFKLKLTTPSTLAEQEKIALFKEKVSLAGDIMDKSLLSSDYIFANIFSMSEDQILQERELIVEDKKRKFRLTQIEEEGNDPAISGMSYGTPHDLASIYKNNASGPTPGLPDEKDLGNKVNAVGRPKTHASVYGTDKSPMGRDPLGKVDNKPEKSDTKKNNIKAKPFALESALIDSMKAVKGKKVRLYEQREEEISIMDEKNIKGL